MGGEKAQSSSGSAFPDPTAPIQLAKHIHGYASTQLVFVAAKLGIADLLKDGERSAEDLAKATGTVEARLYRVLRALASLGVFVESSPGHFALTALAEPLLSESPRSLRGLAIMMGSPWHVGGWSSILHSVQTEGSAFAGQFGQEFFPYLEDHPDAANEFHDVMTFSSRQHVALVANAYDFSEARTIVDVGGGHGFLLTGILKKCPDAQGILIDRPEIADAARDRIRQEGLEARCTVKTGDFFDTVPAAGDLYILKFIIHDWDDRDAIRILSNCRDAMPAGAKLLVIDMVVAQVNPSFEQAWSDIEMMILLPNGRERTLSEFSALFEAAGLDLARKIPLRSGLSILECTSKPESSGQGQPPPPQSRT